MKVWCWWLVPIFSAGVASCGLDDMLEGCGSERDALAAESLAHSAGADFDLAGLALPLPEGYLYRIRGGILELFVAPGVYCDSGGWGVIGEGFARLQVHEGPVPVDPFLYFPGTHRGYAREQIDLGRGPFDYSFVHNAGTWDVRAYFSNVYHPHVIFMYLKTELLLGSKKTGLSIHYFPGDRGNALPEITAAIDEVARNAARGAR